MFAFSRIIWFIMFFWPLLVWNFFSTRDFLDLVIVLINVFLSFCIIDNIYSIVFIGVGTKNRQSTQFYTARRGITDRGWILMARVCLSRPRPHCSHSITLICSDFSPTLNCVGYFSFLEQSGKYISASTINDLMVGFYFWNYFNASFSRRIF